MPDMTAKDVEIVASLDPIAQRFALQHRANCLARGVPFYYFTSGRRSRAEQAHLDVTLADTAAAKPGSSKHEVGMAWDANNASSKPMTPAQWSVFGDEARKLGLIWGGDWRSKDMGHVEMPQSRSKLAAYVFAKVAALGALLTAFVFAARKIATP